ncbi:SDR family NAD(P)-dependent oxidoreductase [Catellatospora tritici]|uniref:SDR family NAD(P)-dependent oxidoreductase n=1 Tax=Catellatospora tritici TaxID=2851566 RepID=UPI001C2D6436|nr:SDR family NAD(P)-dependent oxidoreductase [Catellatospora tritici]MBV1853162.1 SDR family NAD(P)-dependent oxidoreductase [Catellatospora tritici]
MSSIFVTGSADGIGLETARALLRDGHRVVLHARSEARAAQVRAAVPEAAAVVVGDVSELTQTRALALAANALGPYDAVIHNVGVGGGSAGREVTPDGIERIFAINVLAPYLLTALMPPPSRLVYLTSGLEAGGHADLDDPQYERKPWRGMQAYSDSKMYDVVLAFAVARRWPDTLSNAVDPGWIKTRMGGPNAPDELPDGAETQVWLASAPESEVGFTGRYLKRRRDLPANPAAYDESVQDRLLALCAELTGQQLAG